MTIRLSWENADVANSTDIVKATKTARLLGTDCGPFIIGGLCLTDGEAIAKCNHAPER